MNKNFSQAAKYFAEIFCNEFNQKNFNSNWICLMNNYFHHEINQIIYTFKDEWPRCLTRDLITYVTYMFDKSSETNFDYRQLFNNLEPKYISK